MPFKGFAKVMNKRILVIFSSLLVVALSIGYLLWDSPKTPITEEIFKAPELTELEQIEDQYKFGLPINLFEVKEGKIKWSQTFADILLPYNVSPLQINQFEKISKPVHSVRKLVTNKRYSIFYKEEDGQKNAAYFVYEPNDLEYVVYQIEDSLAVSKHQKKIQIVERTMSGVITQSLSHSIIEQGGSPALVNSMADIYGWVLSLRGLHRGDWFKVVYEDRIVDGQSVGIGNVVAAEFNHINNTYLAYGYDQGDGLNFFNEQGESLQKAFLRYPVEFSRISSRYDPRRFHPVLKRRTPHLGTDYAAGRGTPIKAAADGIIINRGWTNGNGNYVKIRHNGTYTTGYLHMNKFGRFKQGQRVKRGDVIGYVGKTGLATGYHLCFRFWKNGRQVDFLNEKLPADKPMKEDQIDKFQAALSLLDKKLNDIPNTWDDKTISAAQQ